MPQWVSRSVCFGVLVLAGIHAARAQTVVGEAGLGLFGGPAWKTGASSLPFQMGIGADANLFRLGHGRAVAGPAVEGGFFRPALSGTGNYYTSVDAMLGRDQWAYATAGRKLRPFAVAGYTRIFNATESSLTSANAVNFGAGVDRSLREDLWLRVELREHYTPSTDSHALVLRIGIVGVDSLR